VDALVNQVGTMPYTGNMEFVIRAVHSGFKVIEAPIHHYPRTNRPGFYGIKDIPKITIKHLKSMIKLRKELVN